MATTKLLELEFGDSINSIARMTAELKVLKLQFKEAEIGTKTFDTLGKEVKTLETEIKKLTNVTKENTNALGGINTSAKFADNSLGKLKQQIKENNEQLLKINVNGKLYKALQAEQAVAVQKRIDIEKKLPSLFQERIKDAIDEAHSIRAVRLEMKELTAIILAGGEGSKDAAKRLAELKDKLDDVQDATKILKGTGIEQLNASMRTFSEALQNFDGDKFKLAMNGIGTAMKAIPIFLLLEGIKLLIENFDKIFAFAQSFTDVAKEAKKLQLEHEKLVKSTESQVRALGLLEAKQNAQITLMVAEGKGIKEVEEAEKKLQETKIKKLKLQAIELGSAAMAAAAKVREIEQNETIEMGLYRIAGAIAGGTTKKAADIIVNQKKAEAEKESNKIISESLNGIADITGQIIELNAESAAKTITNNKQIADSRRQAAREIKQSEIDLIKDQFERQKAQAIFDADNRKEDLRLNKEFYLNKKELASNITKLQNKELEAINREAIKFQQDLENELSQFKIDLIRNDYEREAEQIKLEEKKALEQAVITYAENAEQFNAVKVEIQKKYAEENRQLALEYVKKDLIAEQELIIESQYSNLVERFDARQNLLKEQHEQEMQDFQGTENEKLLKEQEYAKKSVQIELDKAEAKRQIREAEITFAKDLALSLNNIAILFAQDQEQQSALAKSAALINIGANTASAISNLVAVSFSSASPDNIATGGLAAYVKLATGILAITTNMAQAKQVLNSFEEGGFTGEGNPSEVSTNLGSKPYTYHKSEYVIPARVLGTQRGSELANQAESIRLGISNPKPFIGGFYDGGFTQRAASSGAESTFAQNRMLQDAIAKMPQPVLRITELNKVQGASERAVITSAL